MSTVSTDLYYSSKDGQYIRTGNQFIIDGITYPPIWLYQATDEQKFAIGLEPVVVINEPADPEYYIVSEKFEKALLAYINEPRDVDQVKEAQIAKVKLTAFSILISSDWRIVKSAETSTPVPQAWLDFRESIRNYSASAVTSINSCTDVSAIRDIMSALSWPDQPA